MLQPALVCLVLSALVHTFQIIEALPQSGHHGQACHTSILDDREWRLDALPDPNATDHLVFDTVHSLLQHWPNTRMRNGHNIVPGIIPEGTVLYHGTDSSKLPPGPEWYAFNAEHAYFFCREPVLSLAQGSWLHTVATTQPLKIIYFDGSSAVKLPWGTIDTQDLLSWGEMRPQDLWAEITRAEALCKWAKRFGVDGFVRMEVGFELLLCDFAVGVTVVSAMNTMGPQSEELMTLTRPLLETLISGSLQNRFPGETRIHLDLAGLVSFYDTELVPSLVPIRANQERWDHRVQNTSRQDLSAVLARLEATVTRPADQSSGTSWTTLIQVLVDRYAGRLSLTRHLLNSPVPTTEHMRDLANKVQIQLRVMLTPYLLLSAVPTDGFSTDWSVPIYKLCATTHVRRAASLQHAMTDSEKLILRAVTGTNGEICRVVTRMWAAGVHAGVDPSLTGGSPDVAELERLWGAWGEDLNRLVEWLDWSVWVKCEPECSPEEMCYLPTWPIEFPDFPRPWESDRPWWDADMPDSDAWIRPQPTCLSQTQGLAW